MTAPDLRHAALPGGTDWALWRWINVRGAGFPVKDVLRFASGELASAVDRYLAARERERGSRWRAIGACHGRRRELDAAGKAEMGRLMNRLHGRAAPPPIPGHPLEAAIEDVRAAVAAVQEARRRVEQAYAAERTRTQMAVLETARDPRFEEAVIWQNRAAFKGGIAPLLRAGAKPSPPLREERLVASYLQRYAAKNDTIGFFGPEGCGRISDDGPAIAVEAGPTLLATRTTYFEYWAVAAIADRLAEDPEIRRWVAPRRMPTVRVEGELLLDSRGGTTPLDPREVALLRAADGRRSAASIAREVTADPALGLRDEGQVFEGLETLAARGWLTWTLEVPTGGVERPEKMLRRLLEGIEGEQARATALSVLDDIVQARDRVAEAAGDPRALDLALDALESVFRRRTGREPTHSAGRTYAGRTLVYEDCRRDLDLSVGPAFLEAIAAPLRLLLASARWYTHRIAEKALDLFHDQHRVMARESGRRDIELDLFLARGQSVPGAVVPTVIAELQAKWSRLLELGTGEGEVRRSAEALRPAVMEAFAAPHPGWPIARHNSPDLLVVARGLDRIRAGDYRVVLGELHAGVNTCMNAVFVAEHPRPAELVADFEADIMPTADPVLPRSIPGQRTKVLAQTSHDISIEVDETRAWRDRDRVLAIGELFVKEEAGQLLVEHRRLPIRFHLIELAQIDLMLASRHLFEPLPPARHAARVAIDDFVLRRETWRFEPQEYEFARVGDRLERFVAARRWAQQHHLPRFLFAKIPEEKKPWYVDLDSEIYVDLLAKMLRGASRLTVTEMLPSIDDTWLPDREGALYVSELRLVAVDPEPWRPPPPR